MSLIVSIKAIANNENEFNILCRSMAKNNFSLASRYIKDISDIFASSINNKDRFINLTKACLLVLRVPLLYIPAINRVTQIFLRLLSPKLTKEFVNSQGFFKTIEERKIRYSVKTCEDACLFYQIDPETKNVDKAKFMRVIRMALNEKEKNELRDKLAIHAELPSELVVTYTPITSKDADKKELMQFTYVDPDAIPNAVQNPEEFFGPLTEQGKEGFNSWIRSNSNPTQIQDDLGLD